MGTKGREIVDMDVDELSRMLNAALADEWLAAHQYWAGAQIIKGPMRPYLEEELREHAKEEFEHANMLAERIVQLGGTPIIDPKKWEEKANCQYTAPTEVDVMSILLQNIEAEQCAIKVYNNMLKAIGKCDPITFNTIRKIMQEEIEHEQELEDIKEDLLSRQDRSGG